MAELFNVRLHGPYNSAIACRVLWNQLPELGKDYSAQVPIQKVLHGIRQSATVKIWHGTVPGSVPAQYPLSTRLVRFLW